MPSTAKTPERAASPRQRIRAVRSDERDADAYSDKNTVRKIAATPLTAAAQSRILRLLDASAGAKPVLPNKAQYSCSNALPLAAQDTGETATHPVAAETS